MMRILVFASLLLLPSIASAWTIKSSFEGGQIGAIAQGGNGFHIAGLQTTFDATHVHSGARAAKLHWEKPVGCGASDPMAGEGWFQEHGEYRTPPFTNEIWYRGYFYFPTGFKFNAWDVSKFMRVASSHWQSLFFNVNQSGYNQLVESNEEIDRQVDIPNGGKNALPTGQWVCVELYLKFGKNGVFRTWLNGKMIYERTGFDGGPGSRGPSGAKLLFMTTWNGWCEHATYSQDHWVDDVVITTDFEGLTPQADSRGNLMIGPSGGSSPPPAPPGKGKKSRE